MAKQAKVKQSLVDAVQVKAIWNAIPELKLGNVSLNDFLAVHEETDRLDKQYTTKDVELTGIRNSRDDSARSLADMVTRFRSAIRAAYGSDSSQWEQAGGTRSSSRKAPTRRANATSGAAHNVVNPA